MKTPIWPQVLLTGPEGQDRRPRPNQEAQEVSNWEVGESNYFVASRMSAVELQEAISQEQKHKAKLRNEIDSMKRTMDKIARKADEISRRSDDPYRSAQVKSTLRPRSQASADPVKAYT